MVGPTNNSKPSSTPSLIDESSQAKQSTNLTAKKVSLVAFTIFAAIIGGVLLVGGATASLAGIVAGAALGLLIALVALKIGQAVGRLSAINSQGAQGVNSQGNSISSAKRWSNPSEKIEFILTKNNDCPQNYKCKPENFLPDSLADNADQALHQQKNGKASLTKVTDPINEDAFEQAEASESIQNRNNLFYKEDSATADNKKAPFSQDHCDDLKDNNPINTGFTCLPFKPSGSRKTEGEDGFSQLVDSRFTLTSVMDGHNGRATVDFLEANLLKNIAARLSEKFDNESGELTDESIGQALYDAFAETNRQYFEHVQVSESNQEDGSGAAATVVLQIDGAVWTATVGDCRAVLVSDDHQDPIQLSVDCDTDDIKKGFTKEEDLTHEQYLKLNNGTLIIPVQIKGKVLGYQYEADRTCLASSKTCECFRAFGDLEFPGVTATPKITKHSIRDPQAKIIVVSDGVTKSASSEQIQSYARTLKSEGKTNSEIASSIAYKARSVKRVKKDGSESYPNNDDITCAVFNLFRS